MKRMMLIIKLFMLSFIGKNHKKAELLRQSGLFQFYGGGGIGILIGFHRIRSLFRLVTMLLFPVMLGFMNMI